ncbi:MAG: VWA domain-containing protein [Alphaproteobacteria bacterium]|nr:VWA domain-containing protein [Alphaproteobacteria bacterium]
MSLRKVFEPEESVGTLWHRLAGDLDAAPAFPEAEVALEQVRGQLAVTFRGLGGSALAELRPAPLETSGHRLSWRRRLGRDSERQARTRFDGETLFLPPRLAVFSNAELNRQLYLWLVAWCVCAKVQRPPTADLLQADIFRLRRAWVTTVRCLTRFPGLRPIYRALADAYLPLRPQRQLPPVECSVEAAVRDLLGQSLKSGDGPGGRAQLGPAWPRITAPRGYRPFLPVPLWAERSAPPGLGRNPRDEQETEPAGGGSGADETMVKAKRQNGQEAERKDSLILHRFESILSWAEFLNLNRTVEDDDEANAKRAAEDQEELSLVEQRRRPATRLAFDLDLAPEDVDRERVAGTEVYPEWDYRTATYLPDHARVLISPVTDPESASVEPFDAATRRRIAVVRRRFEALRPRRQIRPRQFDGDELDLDATVRARCDYLATGETSNRLYRQVRTEDRDLAVQVLLDASRSTESYVDNRQVLEVEKEALAALAYGLASCGDDLAICAFSSLKRQRVYLQTVKRFDEAMDRRVEARIAALRPGFYTRLGAALRYCTKALSLRAKQKRLLLLLTDGKPNDLDHYEGRYGIEDTRRAVLEARRAGHAVFAVTIDAKAQSYIPRIFGPGGFAVISHPDRLTTALPAIYRQLVD